MNSIEEEFASMSSEHASSAVYQAGVLAFRSGKHEPNKECPYSSKEGRGIGEKRMIWMLGYYHARIKRLL